VVGDRCPQASSNDYIGQAKLELSDVHATKQFEGWFPVTSAKKNKTKPRGEIQIKYRVFTAEGMRRFALTHDHVLLVADRELITRLGAEVNKGFWKGIFDYFNLNGDGGISHLELAGLLEGIGAPMSDDQLHDLVRNRITSYMVSCTPRLTHHGAHVGGGIR
jgi:hypothetical protein